MGMGTLTYFQHCSSVFRNRGRNKVHWLVKASLLPPSHWANYQISQALLLRGQFAKYNTARSEWWCLNINALVIWESVKSHRVLGQHSQQIQRCVCTCWARLETSLKLLLGVIVTDVLLPPSQQYPVFAQGVSEAGETQAEAALHPRTTHIKMPPVLLAWGLTHLSTNMEDVSFFMRSRFPMCEYQELLAHDDCRCLSHTVVFNLILTFVW